MLLSDPSYPWGTAGIGIPDPDVLRVGINQQKLPRNDRQQQQLRAFPRIKKVGDGDDGATAAEGESGKVEQNGKEQLKEEDECRGGNSGNRIDWSSLGEVLPSGTPGISPDHLHREVGRGPGGSVPIRWPHSGESVAFSVSPGTPPENKKTKVNLSKRTATQSTSSTD
ncbi:hypothetical protein NDU88_002401 [Pleurodeles waltl]|uniref:Uncharacterized protein n=1 Tax=Pleurodeles waltl TaxID=8319 RepID=A0AAV7SDN3_PLEWA|nr:hypothetical protein NDU88_002401 [Pleurodeles waltl]